MHIVVEQKIIDCWNNLADWVLLRFGLVRAWLIAKWRLMMIPVHRAYDKAVAIWIRHGALIRKILCCLGIAVLVILVLRLLVMITK